MVERPSGAVKKGSEAVAGKKRKRFSKSKRRKRNLAILLFWILVGSAALLLFLGGKFLFEKVSEYFGGPETEATTPVSAEDIRESSEWEQVFAQPERYPDYLLEALERNPEILEFVKNFPEASGEVTGEISREETNEKYPLFLQWDSRWGYVPYGDNVIGLSGCAPTCLSMVVYSLTRDKTATPDVFAEYSTNQGYYVEGTGTSWELLTDIPSKYKVKAKMLGLDETAMKNHLDKGHMIICSMGPGDFTAAGHFIVIYGYGEDGFYVNDPYSRIRSGKSWDYETLQGQIKNLWVYQLR